MPLLLVYFISINGEKYNLITIDPVTCLAYQLCSDDEVLLT